MSGVNSEEQWLIWSEHPKFVFKDNTITIACGSKSVSYKYKLQESRPLLVITDLSWEVFQNTILESGVQMSVGPPGTGKTETFKDTWYYQGMNMCVLSCNNLTPERLAKVMSKVDESYTICIDEFNLCSTETIQKFCELTKALTDQTRIFGTYNPNSEYKNPTVSEVMASVTN